MESLTPRQHDVLAAIQQYQHTYGYVPTVPEWCELVHVSSTCSVQRHIEALQRKGYIVRPPGKARCVKIVNIT